MGPTPLCFGPKLRPAGLKRPRLWGRDSHVKGAGMLIVSLRSVNFGFWSHLRCSGQNAIVFSYEDLV